MNWPLLEKGDTVLIHSSAARTLKKSGMTPEQIIGSFLLAVGKDGTVIFPVFFFSWCEGVPFDIRKLNGETGVLGNAALKMGAVRSGNPVYSFAAIGKLAPLFEMDNFFMLGPGTPFDVLVRLDAKIAALDVDDNHCMTIYHHIEKMEGAPHRFEKIFSGNYTDAYGCTIWKDYSYYVRKDGIVTDVNAMEAVLWEKGVYKGNKPFKGDGLRVAKARDIYSVTAEVIRANGGENVLWRDENAIRQTT